VTPRLPFRPWLPWLVLLTCGALTVLGAVSVDRSGRSRDELRVEATARDVAAAIVGRVDTYVALLRAGTGLFAASDRVSRDEFRQFIAQLDLRHRFPGMQGIGFAQRVDAAAVDALEAEIRAQGANGFRVWPREPVRDVYTSIVYIEPLDGMNQEALGYDMFSEPVRRSAMERAAAEGRPIASGRVTLVQERASAARPQSGFLIYVPLYRRGAPIGTVAERAAALQGFVYAAVRAGDLLETIIRADSHSTTALRLYDGTRVDPDALLYAIALAPDAPAPMLRVQRSLEVTGRTWTMELVALPGFASTSRQLVPSLLLVGFGVSVLLFLLTRAEARARAEAERNAHELGRSEQALRSASRAKDEFLATLSHELRTPLNAILGWTRMVRTGHLDPARQDAALAVVERNARAQARLVEDILDMSRIIMGKLRLDLAVVPINPIVEEAVATVRPAAEAKGLVLECRLDPGAGTIVAAADRVQQIAWNLLSNAIKFTDEGGRVRVSTARGGHTVTLEIRDDGLGIEPSFLPHVFDRFTQADGSTTRTHSGVGLGLAIVRHLVELHGGTIAAASEGLGRGATFTVAFPVRVGETIMERALTRRAGVEAAPGGPGLLAGLSVLVVDDDADSRTLVAAGLAFEGARVLDAGGVDEALVALERHDADVIVCDLAMPGEDGYALVRRVRGSTIERLRAIPVVALTAYGRSEDRDAVLARGFQGFVSKPVELIELVAAVRDVAPDRPAR
jgi:signal transduction histidine kinase/ActR/RegA family two-component response regulator